LIYRSDLTDSEDELEFEDDWGTIASKDKRPDEDQIFFPSDLGQSLSFFNRNRPELVLVLDFLATACKSENLRERYSIS
jgi:hypothetical protein